MNVLARAMRQLRWSIELRGIGGTLRLAFRRLVGRDPGAAVVDRPVHPFDTGHNVDTGGRIGGSHLGSGHPHDIYSTAYVSVPPSRLLDAVARWQGLPGTRPISDYAFFDLGCGKGRAVMVASELGFREVGGVELDPGLATIAKANLESWAKTGKARCPVHVVEGDATEVDLPALPLLVYLYNPFRAPVVRALLARLNAHAGEKRGELDMIYLVPEQATEFETATAFAKLWEGGVRMSEEDRRWDDADPEDAGQIWRR